MREQNERGGEVTYYMSIDVSSPALLFTNHSNNNTDIVIYLCVSLGTPSTAFDSHGIRVM